MSTKPKPEGWMDELEDFWTPPEGKVKVTLTGPVRKEKNKWNKDTYRIPTDRGIMSTGAFSVIRAIKQFFAEYGYYIGAKLSFNARGKEIKRRYLDVKVSKK